jgi:large subunit ribosomal protein L32
MAVPKRKKSKGHVRQRRRSHTTTVGAAVPCQECGSPHLPHRVCPSCGYYRGRQVISVEAV